MAGRADSTVLAGARVVLPTGTVENGRVIVEGTRIADTSWTPLTGSNPARPRQRQPRTRVPPAVHMKARGPSI